VAGQERHDGDSTSFAEIQTVTGTPAPSPSAPSAPANSIVLAQIAVAAGASTPGAITDKRQFTCTAGGILKLPSTASPPNGADGQFAYDAANDRLFHLAASGPRQARVLPFAPAVAVKTSDTSPTGSEVTICSTSVTVDGSTDLEITAICSYIQQTSGTSHSAGAAALRVYIGSTLLMEIQTPVTVEAQWVVCSPIVFRTCAELSNTPAAGTHTISFKFQPSGTSSDTVKVKSSGATQPCQLAVSAVPL